MIYRAIGSSGIRSTIFRDFRHKDRGWHLGWNTDLKELCNEDFNYMWIWDGTYDDKITDVLIPTELMRGEE